jgi:hypothetical protein
LEAEVALFSNFRTAENLENECINLGRKLSGLLDANRTCCPQFAIRDVIETIFRVLTG